MQLVGDVRNSTKQGRRHSDEGARLTDCGPHEVERAVPNQGCAGPVAYIDGGAPSLRICGICCCEVCKRNSGGKTNK